VYSSSVSLPIANRPKGYKNLSRTRCYFKRYKTFP